MDNLSRECQYSTAGPTWSNQYLWPVLAKLAGENPGQRKRVFELGCGNGATADFLAARGFDVTGVDPSISGIAVANKAFPQLKLYEGSAYDDLAAKYGKFPLVVSLEVIEHCFYPRMYAQTVFDLLEDGGRGIISTPYHGYWKNLALAVAGKWDDHLTALWDGGHIKFFSEHTMRILLSEAGFKEISFIRVGRIPLLAKSLVAVVIK